MSSGSGPPIPIDDRGCENGAKTARFRLLDRPQQGVAHRRGRAAASGAARLGAKIVMRPEDIPGIARFTAIRDPLGAVLALMKQSPRAKK